MFEELNGDILFVNMRGSLWFLVVKIIHDVFAKYNAIQISVAVSEEKNNRIQNAIVDHSGWISKIVLNKVICIFSLIW